MIHSRPPHIRLLFSVLLISIVCAACKRDDIFKNGQTEFVKFYGSAFIQEAVDIATNTSGDFYILGNEFVRFQDSAATIIIKANHQGEQLWVSPRHYGRGNCQATAIAVDSNEDVYVLSNERNASVENTSIVLVKYSPAGNPIWSYQTEFQNNYSDMGNAIMIDEEENRIVIAGHTTRNGSRDLLLQTYDLNSGSRLQEIIRSSSRNTSASKILKEEVRGTAWYFVIGNTNEESGYSTNQNVFIAEYSMNFIPNDNIIIGTEGDDEIGDAVFSVNGWISIITTSNVLNTESSQAELIRIGRSRDSLHLLNKEVYSISAVTKGVSLAESDNGSMMLGFVAGEVREAENIYLLKTRYRGEPLWDAPLRIGGNGNDRVRKIRQYQNYIIVLSVIDLQNENQIIALSKINY